MARIDGSGVRSLDAIDGRFGIGSRVYILPGIAADSSPDPSDVDCPDRSSVTDQGAGDS